MLVAIADVQIYKYCCSLERKHANELEHPTQAPNATSNGGDASRVGALRKGSQTEVQILLSVSLYLVYEHYLIFPTRDASPPLERNSLA